MRVTLNSNAVCISISLFSIVLNCKKVGVCKMLIFVPCSAVRIARERGGFVLRSGAVNCNSMETDMLQG